MDANSTATLGTVLGFVAGVFVGGFAALRIDDWLKGRRRRVRCDLGETVASGRACHRPMEHDFRRCGIARNRCAVDGCSNERAHASCYCKAHANPAPVPCRTDGTQEPPRAFGAMPHAWPRDDRDGHVPPRPRQLRKDEGGKGWWPNPSGIVNPQPPRSPSAAVPYVAANSIREAKNPPPRTSRPAPPDPPPPPPRWNR